METARLILRPWREADFKPYAELNADPQVRRFFPSLLTEAESFAQAASIRDAIVQRGWGFWAVELKQTNEFIGFVGLNQVDADSGISNAPLVEIGWRLAAAHWGKRFAPEAGHAALDFAFHKLAITDVYTFTPLTNEPSIRVMRKLGMSDTGSNFNHPKLPSGHPLECHCLYKISDKDFLRLSVS